MAKKGPQTYRLNNMTGGINTISEVNTLASFDYNGQGVQAEAADIENFAPLNRGGWSKVTGFDLYKDTSNAHAITGLYRFNLSSGTNYFLFSQLSKVYKLVSGTITDIGMTISSGAYTHFETANDFLVVCDGVSVPQTWDGASTVANVGDSPPTGAPMSLFYQNRLWLPKGSYVYYSAPNNINSGYSTQFVQCDFNDGQNIVGIFKYFIPGQLVPVILVLKERSAGIITGDGSTGSPYTYIRINQDNGGASFRGATQFGSDVAYLTPRGVTSYKTDSSIVNLIYNYLSEKVRNKFQALNSSALNTSIAWYDWKKTRISFAVPETSNTTPNVIWHYDTRLSAWYKERWNLGQDCTASFIDSDGTWYHGDSNGKIYSHGTSYNFDGQAINAFYTTGYMDFGDPSMYKHIRQSRIMMRGNGIYNLGISPSYNYGLHNGTTTSLQLSTGAYSWGGGTWTSSSSTYQWGGSPIRFAKFFPGGDFQNIQFTFSQSGLNQPIDIFEIEFITEYTGLF